MGVMQMLFWVGLAGGASVVAGWYGRSWRAVAAALAAPPHAPDREALTAAADVTVGPGG